MSQLKPLSPRQAQVLRVMILHLLEQHTHAPLRVIAEALKTRSLVNVRAHIDALARKGYVEARDKGNEGRATWRVLFTPDGQRFHLGNLAAVAPDLTPAVAMEAAP
jgi:predicted ArsR family transcriptional regulator